MCCLAEFIVKYTLIIGNIVFSLAGLAIIGLGTAAHINLKNINEVIPSGLQVLTIGIIVIGCIVFVIAFCACCGAIRESRCMLITYAVFMGILAAVKIYITVVIFNFLSAAKSTVTEWLTRAFNNNSARPAFHAMETLFLCCGTNGADAYSTIGQAIPPSCCDVGADQCSLVNSYDGCIDKVGNYFENFGEAIGIVLIVIIIVECVCLIFSVFLSCQIKNNRYR